MTQPRTYRHKPMEKAVCCRGQLSSLQSLPRCFILGSRLTLPSSSSSFCEIRAALLSLRDRERLEQVNVRTMLSSVLDRQYVLLLHVTKSFAVLLGSHLSG